MGLRIHNDHSRFNDVVRGRIKKNLKDYIKNGEFISKQGNEKISVPLSRVDLPIFASLIRAKAEWGRAKAIRAMRWGRKKKTKLRAIKKLAPILLITRLKLKYR